VSPDDPVVITAYCAPGRKGASELILALNGDPGCNVVEHPYMTGRTDVILVSPSALGADPPFPTLFP
jgi:hypothetical protein